MQIPGEFFNLLDRLKEPWKNILFATTFKHQLITMKRIRNFKFAKSGATNVSIMLIHFGAKKMENYCAKST